MHRKTKNKEKREKFRIILKIKMLYADNQRFMLIWRKCPVGLESFFE
jgi:hypothetical protein